jgi:hypothetical protein
MLVMRRRYVVTLDNIVGQPHRLGSSFRLSRVPAFFTPPKQPSTFELTINLHAYTHTPLYPSYTRQSTIMTTLKGPGAPKTYDGPSHPASPLKAPY